MQQNLPSPIKNDNDLHLYEGYLKDNKKDYPYPITIEDKNMSYIPTENKNVPETLKNTAYMPAFLSKHIGKLVRVEFYLCGTLQSKTGILMTVGAGYIVLRSDNSSTLVCHSDSIRFVTIIHDNDPQRLLSF